MKTTKEEGHSRRLLSDISLLDDIRTDLEALLHADVRDRLLKRIESRREEAVDLLYLNHDRKAGLAKLDVAVVGNFNSGKSSFINSLLGVAICPVKAIPTTSSLTEFVHGQRRRVLVGDADSDPTEEISLERYTELVCHSPADGQTKRYRFRIEFPLDVFCDVKLIDTPGFQNDQNAHDSVITRERAKAADVLIFVMDLACGELTKDEVDTIVRMISPEMPCYLVINKADLDTPAVQKKVLDRVRGRHGDRFRGLFLYSAKDELASAATALAVRLQEMQLEMQEAVRTRQPFQCTASGVMDQGRYAVVVNGNKYDFDGASAPNLSRRFDLVALLESIARQKQEILEASQARQLKSYQRGKARLLNDVRSELNASISTKKRRTPEEAAILEQAEGLKGKIRQTIRKTINSAPHLLQIMGHSKKGFLGLSSEVWRVQVPELKTLKRNMIFDDLRREILEFSRSFELKSQNKIQRDLDQAVASTESELYGLLKTIRWELGNDYATGEAAQKAIKQACKECQEACLFSGEGLVQVVENVTTEALVAAGYKEGRADFRKEQAKGVLAKLDMAMKP